MFSIMNFPVMILGNLGSVNKCTTIQCWAPFLSY